MRHELLTPAEMGEVDRHAIATGPFDGPALMENAGRAVFREILARFPGALHHAVLCGPGNNGGDGFVVARLLAETGLPVAIHAEGVPRAGSDAQGAAARCPLPVLPLDAFEPRAGWLVVDALYGAGFSRPLSPAAARAAGRCAALGKDMVVAVDIPSGVSGATGAVADIAFEAGLTVTFACRKPGHLLMPGRAFCGEVVVADIGIRDADVASVEPRCFENLPTLWGAGLPAPAGGAHKFSRGHVAVFSGGASSTGAARLAAAAAARAGAGVVTVLAPPDAVRTNASMLTAIMVAGIATAADAVAFAAARKVRAAVIGPGFGVGPALRELVLALLGATGQAGGEPGLLEGGLVLDADAITAFRERPAELFEAAARSGRPAMVLTPHEGEFARLFPDLAVDAAGMSKVERARVAARRSGAVVVLKGPDTVVASPDGRAAVNANGVAWLATAGSGDVLAGLVGGLLAQGMPPWEAACAAVWIHAEAGARAGAGLTADDLPHALLPVLQSLL